MPQQLPERPAHLVGAHVTMRHGGSILLGEVVGHYLSPLIEGERYNAFKVRHFNGEPWPVDPYFHQLTILERTYPPTEEE